MAKLTYLQLTNRVLKRITQSEITDVSTATGHALIITELINEAQNELYKETNWYSLYSTRTFPTVADTDEYAVASDYGRCIDMMDTTNNIILIENYTRNFDVSDPDADYTGNPLWFTLQGTNYRLYPIPAGAYTIRERYWKIPDTLTANANTSDLPIEVENCIIQYALAQVLYYQNKFEHGDRAFAIYNKQLDKAKITNKKMIDRFLSFRKDPWVEGISGITPPKFPSGYPRVY